MTVGFVRGDQAYGPLAEFLRAKGMSVINGDMRNPPDTYYPRHPRYPGGPASGRTGPPNFPHPGQPIPPAQDFPRGPVYTPGPANGRTRPPYFPHPRPAGSMVEHLLPHIYPEYGYGTGYQYPQTNDVDPSLMLAAQRRLQGMY